MGLIRRSLMCCTYMSMYVVHSFAVIQGSTLPRCAFPLVTYLHIKCDWRIGTVPRRVWTRPFRHVTYALALCISTLPLDTVTKGRDVRRVSEPGTCRPPLGLCIAAVAASSGSRTVTTVSLSYGYCPNCERADRIAKPHGLTTGISYVIPTLPLFLRAAPCCPLFVYLLNFSLLTS